LNSSSNYHLKMVLKMEMIMILSLIVFCSDQDLKMLEEILDKKGNRHEKKIRKTHEIFLRYSNQTWNWISNQNCTIVLTTPITKLA